MDEEEKNPLEYATDYYIQNTLKEYIDQLQHDDDDTLPDKPPVVFGYV